MFADVRGSTPLGERLGPRGLHEMMDRFYNAGVEALIEHGAIVDRFMGDQVVGYFTPGFAPRHARQAVRCGLEILRVTGHDNPPPWIPVGVGVHTGEGFIGVVGKSDELVEITALGEDVNVAARLASVALTGEAVVSEAAFVASGTKSDAERRELELKGVSTPVRVRIIKVASTRAAPEHG